MSSGVPAGYLEPAGRVRTLSTPVSVAGVFQLEFSEEFDAFALQLNVGTAALRSVLVGFGKPQVGAEDRAAAATEVIDPAAFAGIKRLSRPTRWVTVYVATPIAAGTLYVSGVEADPIPRAPAAVDILAALNGSLTVAANATIVRSSLTWTAGARVALGAASATILAANAARRAFRLVNSGAVPAAIRLEAAAAVFATHLPFAVGAVLEEGVDGDSCYKGEIRGITGGAAGEAFAQEAT